jgi:hypothetical protein
MNNDTPITENEIRDWLVLFEKRAEDLLRIINNTPDHGDARQCMNRHVRNRVSDNISDWLMVIRSEAHETIRAIQEKKV